MKVLHLFNEIQYSGAEIMYANSASLFAEKGVDLLAFSTGKSMGSFAPIFTLNNIKTYHKRINFIPLSKQGIAYYTRLYYFIKQQGVGALHIHRSDLYFAAIIAWVCGVPCVKTQHSAFKNRILTRCIAIARRFVLRVFFNVIFHSIGETVQQNELKYYKNHSIRINNWFDNKRFFPLKNEDEKRRIRKDLKIPCHSFVIISTGACTDNKNHADIIKAISLLNPIKNILYLHLGIGEIEKRERKLAVDLHITDKVRFLGNCNNVRDYLVASDVYVMPSFLEGLGNAALEAMACKLPTILYDSPGLRDLIKNDVTGFLIPPDYKILAEKINCYFENSNIGIRKAEKAYALVLKEFNLSKSIHQILKLYRVKEV